MTKVSVIIPTYNYDKYICDAIDSVLDQTFKEYEIIVIDDGSKDNTEYKIKKYKEKINYYYIENRGPAAARNYGIERAKGEYISFLDADDAFVPEKLELQVDVLEKDGGIGLVHSDFLYVNNKLSSIYYHYRCEETESHNKALEYLWNHNYINTSTVMLRKKAILQHGLFNESYRYGEDFEMWLRLGKHYKFHCIRKPLVKTRSHSRNHCKKMDNVEKVNCTKEIRSRIKEYYKDKGVYNLNIR